MLSKKNSTDAAHSRDMAGLVNKASTKAPSKKKKKSTKSGYKKGK